MHTAEGTLSGKIAGLKSVVEDHARSSSANIQEMNSCLAQLEGAAKKTKQDLEAGAKKWEAAVKDFENAHRRINQMIADLESRPWRSHWVMGVLLIAAARLGYSCAKLGWAEQIKNWIHPPLRPIQAHSGGPLHGCAVPGPGDGRRLPATRRGGTRVSFWRPAACGRSSWASIRADLGSVAGR